MTLADALAAKMLPPEGWLMSPEGLTRFQQTDFIYETALQILERKSSKNGSRWVNWIQLGSFEEICENLTRKPKETRWVTTRRYPGILRETEEDRICPQCGATMHVSDESTTQLRHLPSGDHRTVLEVNRKRYRCPHCGKSALPDIPFKAENHRITKQLENFIRSLCAAGMTLVEIAELTGVDRHIAQAIDKKRLKDLYTKDGELIRPEKQAKALGIDEFKLANGHKYATIIIDIETGEALWVRKSKKKQVVYDFIDHVGLEWMAGVEAICCDMNADYEAAFRERCPHLVTVFDRFHIIKNFNDKVISNVRKDEQRRLQEEGNPAAARKLKGSKYILMSSRSTLRQKDQQADAGKVIRQGSEMFGMPEVKQIGGREARYEALLEENHLLFLADYVKEALAVAFQQRERDVMAADIREIIAVCRSAGNKHFNWFANLLENHFDGIVAHADYPYSSGKVEGTNGLIKAVRRRAFGFRDNEYFFLKIFDATRRPRRC